MPYADPEKRKLKARDYGRAYYERHRDKEIARVKAYVAAHPKPYDSEKMPARQAVVRALRSGALVRPDNCGRCGVLGKPTAHHADYSKPLEVEWLCTRCHGLLHRKPRL